MSTIYNKNPMRAKNRGILFVVPMNTGITEWRDIGQIMLKIYLRWQPTKEGINIALPILI